VLPNEPFQCLICVNVSSRDDPPLLSKRNWELAGGRNRRSFVFLFWRIIHTRPSFPLNEPRACHPETFDPGTNHSRLTHIASPIAVHRILGLTYVGRRSRTVAPCDSSKISPHYPLSRCLLAQAELRAHEGVSSLQVSSIRRPPDGEPLLLFCEVRVD